MLAARRGACQAVRPAKSAPLRACAGGYQGLFAAAALVMLLAMAFPWFAPRTVTLSLPTFDCLVRPFTVKKALGTVEDVRRTEVYFGKRQAVVSFDDAQISLDALTRATTDAGYPSTVVRGAR